MHPILARRWRLVFYLAVFLQAGLLLGELMARSTGSPRIAAIVLATPLMLVHAFSCLAAWFLCRSIPLDENRPERLLVVHLAAALAACGLLVAVGTTWAHLLSGATRFRDSATIFSASTTLVVVFALLLFSLAVAVHYLFIAAAASREAEKRAYELRILAQEAELKALRNQIDPHFLFNSLNSISSLVVSDPKQAREMCIRLADFLRRSLRFGALESIPLAEEIALAEAYLAVEQVRFGERLRVECAIDDGCGEWRVPPLVLLPLIENAIRHGIGHLPEGGTVAVRAARRGGRLDLAVENPCDADRSSSAGEGIGLANLRRRLDTGYDLEALLKVRESAERFQVEISLPARTR
ncbi:MAG: sensor histidine kinase [bacterium]|nr:sensor histidine kinase [bacterium]